MYRGLLIIIFLFGLSHLLFALPGDLDPSFDLDGIVTTDFGFADLGINLAVQTDGKIVVVGYSGPSGGPSDFAIVRYNSDGSLDSLFDGDGKVITDFGGNDDGAHAVVIQPDNKIVVAGSTLPNPGITVLAVARYNPDGSLDSSFDGDGRVTTDFFGSGGTAWDIDLQSDGKILVAGSAGGNFALARYNNDGSLDNTFGSGGKITTDFNGGGDYAYGLVLQSDGKIVLAGEAFTGTGGDFALVRYNTDGSLDLSFDGDGKVTTQFDQGNDNAQAVALQADGKIVAAGIAGAFDYALARYNTDGSLDSTFDGDGKVTTDFSGQDEGAFGVAVQQNGKIVAAGDSGGDFALARYNSDGSLDLSFSQDGKVTTDFGSGSVDLAVALQQDGKIIAAGYSSNNFAVARYEGDASCVLFCDDFEDGVLASDWTYVKPLWNETGGNLVGTPSGRKAETIASPVFAGCSVCNIQASMNTGGGLGNKLWLLAWYLDKQNTIELLMKEENDKWILRQRVNGVIVAKIKGFATILPNVFYNVEIRFDGVNFELLLDGTPLANLPAFSTPNGTVGFRSKNTTGKFGFISVY